MSFGSGNVNLPPSDPTLANLNSRETATNEQAIPVPYFAGTPRLGMKFIGEDFNRVAQPIYQDTKKGAIQSGWNYFTSFVVLIGSGPGTGVFALYEEEEKLWEGAVLFDGADYVDITVMRQGFACPVRVYAGNETQTIDSTLPLHEDGDPMHPAYRGQIYAVFTNWFLGYNRTNVGNLKFVISRHPSPTGFTEAANVQGDCNPVAILMDWWMNPLYGMGQTNARLDLGRLNSVAHELAIECAGVSPVVDTVASFRQLVMQLCEYFDGYRKYSASGKLSLGLIRQVGTADDIPEFTEDDMTEPPDYQPNDFATTLNLIYVKFINRLNDFKSDAAPGESGANRQVTGMLKGKVYDRLWVTRQAYAQTLANIMAVQSAVPIPRGTLHLRKSRLGSLAAGDAFKFSYAHFGLCHLRCRAKTISQPSPGTPEVTVDWEIDRGNLNGQFSSPGLHLVPSRTVYEPEPITAGTILELPYTSEMPARVESLAFMAARPTSLTTRMSAYRKLSSGTYAVALDSAPFWQHGVLHADYPAGTALIDDVLGLTIDMDGVDTELVNTTLEDALANPVLAVVGNELMWLFGATLVDTRRYAVKAVRARYDTAREAHSMGEDVYLIREANLMVWRVATDEALQTFKLQPFVQGVGYDLSDITPISRTLTARTLRPLRPLNLRAYGSTSPEVPSGNNLPVNWDIATDERKGFWNNWTANLPETVIEILVGGTVLLTRTLDAGVDSTVFDNADLVAAIGAESSFTVRAYHQLNGYRSALHATLDVTWSGSGGSSGTNLIPAMTSNSAPFGEASASQFNSNAWNAFNHDQLGDGEGGATGTTLPWWLQYRFPSPVVVTSYKIFPHDAPGGGDPESPQAWTFEGSNDGGSWTTLDTQSGVTAWTRGIGNVYTFSNSTAYLYYRINVSAANNYPTIAELEMYL